MRDMKPRHLEGPVIVDENEFEDTLCQACQKGKLDFIKTMETLLEDLINDTTYEKNNKICC